MPKKDFNQTLRELKLINDKGALKAPIIETHCHLDSLKAQSTEELINKATKLGIEKIVTICVGPENFSEVLSLADQFKSVYTTQGIHPHEAHSAREDHFEQISTNLAHTKVVAVGEIGLDYHYDFSPRDKQIDCFEKQLQLACDHDLPVVIHTRKAEEDTKSIIQNFASQLKRKGVFHSYTSSKELAQVAIDLDFYIGFNGIITFKNAQEVREVLEMTPLDRIVLETDAPYLTPSPHRGTENSPLFLPFIAQCASDIKNLDPDIVCQAIYENSNNLFRFS